MSLLLTALKTAPALFSAGKEIYNAVSGHESEAATPEDLAADIENLTSEQRAEIEKKVLELKDKYQGYDTERFLSLTDGSVEKIRETARPEIALRCMAMMEAFLYVFKILILATVLQWFAQWFVNVFGVDMTIPSIWESIAKAQPVAEMIWAPLLASFIAAVEVIKKYMGCRERDKAREDEMRHGKPLQSVNATIESAGGVVANLVKAFKR